MRATRSDTARSWLLAVWAGMLLAAWCPTAVRADAVLDVARPLDDVSLDGTVMLLEDRQGTYGLDDVRAPTLAARFRQGAKGAASFGYTDSVYWVRITASNATARSVRWLLELAYPHLDDVTLYAPRKDGGYGAIATGDLRPFSTRPIAHRTFVFPLLEPPRGRQVYYVRIATSSSMSLPFKAWDQAAFIAHLPRDLGMLFLFYGIALAMAAYHLLAYAFIRKGEILLYVAQVLATGFMQLALSGHAFQFLVPNQPWVTSRLLEWSFALALATACYVGRVYVAIGDRFPVLDKRVLYAGHACLLLGVVAHVVSIRVGTLLLAVTFMLITIAALSLSLYFERKQVPRIRLYILAWLSTIVGISVFALKTYGFLPNSVFTTWSYHIGSAIQIVLLSSAVAEWVNSMRSDLGALNEALSQKVDALEGALKQAEDATARAEEATRTKAEFVATMSHELRTPLNAIINVPQGLLKDFARAASVTCERCASTFELERGERVAPETPCPECGAAPLRPGSFVKYGGKPEHTAHYLALIERSGKHLLQMVNSILDASKLDAGRLVLAVERFEMPALLAEVVDEMGDSAQRAGVSIALECAANVSALRADPLRIKQVVINLLSNAIKFSEGRGPITVAVNPAVDGCVVSVKDRGIGIAEEDFERIFASFEQVHKGNTRKYGGTGLGLSISRTLVRMHGGELWVESTPGTGTTFHFSIPSVSPSEVSPGNSVVQELPRPSLMPRRSQELSS